MALDLNNRDRLQSALAFIISQKVPKSTLNTLAKPPTRPDRERAIDGMARILADQLTEMANRTDYKGTALMPGMRDPVTGET